MGQRQVLLSSVHGNGVSKPVTRAGGASRWKNACSVTKAKSSPPKTPVLGASCTVCDVAGALLVMALALAVCLQPRGWFRATDPVVTNPRGWLRRCRRLGTGLAAK